MQKLVLGTLVTLLAFSGIALYYTDNSVTLQLQNETTSKLDYNVYNKYVTWKLKFGKNINGSEDQLRFKIFSENLNFIEKNNSDKSSRVVLGLTEFADLSNEEYRNLMTTKIYEAPSEQKQMKNLKRQTQKADFATIDWTQKGAVTSIKNQGSCGACWAFATVGSLEGLQAITTGTLESLSNQQVLSCTSKLVSGGCNGGNALYGYNYVANNGIQTESDYPYTNGNSGTTQSCQADLSQVVFKNKGKGSVESNNPDAMYQQLTKQPLAVGVDAASLYFQLYNGGVITNKNCGTSLNHQITLVGYDATMSAWQVKNSWGTSWGKAGFAFIDNQSGNGICGINMDVQYPTA